MCDEDGRFYRRHTYKRSQSGSAILYGSVLETYTGRIVGNRKRAKGRGIVAGQDEDVDAGAVTDEVGAWRTRVRQTLL